MKTYLLVNIEQTHSTHNAVDLYRLSWIDTDSGEVYETTTDESYRNHSKWQSIIRDGELGYYSGLKRSKRKTAEGITVISADSRPRLVRRAHSNEIRDIIQSVLYEPKNTFNKLFETQ